MAEARFCHWYPGRFSNGSIGWLKFWQLYWKIPNVQAEWRVYIAQAIGYALADEKSQKPFLDAWREAYKDG